MDPHLVRFVPEDSSKNLESYIEEDNSCANDNQEPNNNGRSELSENVTHLKSIFVTTVKEVSAATKTKEEDLNNAHNDDGERQKDIIDELKQDSPDISIKEHVNLEAESDAVENETNSAEMREENAVAEEKSAVEDNCILEEESRKQVKDILLGQINHIAGENFLLNHALFLYSSGFHPIELAGFFDQSSSSKKGWKMCKNHTAQLRTGIGELAPITGLWSLGKGLELLEGEIATQYTEQGQGRR